LTPYPVGYSLPNNVPNITRGTLLLPGEFGSVDVASGDNILRIRGWLFRDTLPNGKDEPILCQLYAAGFNFCIAEMVHQCCPYDGNLHHLFVGEELSMAVRLFTSCFDMHAPAQSVCYHLWSQLHRPLPLSRTAAENGFVQASKKKSLVFVRQQLMREGSEDRVHLNKLGTNAKSLIASFLGRSS
jgi:Glycosyltransferase (GlcNAc)